MSKLRTLASGTCVLKIHSLKDTNATCSCGGWSLLKTTNDNDDEKTLLKSVQAEFKKHLKER